MGTERGTGFLLVTPDWLACLAECLGVNLQDLVSKWIFFIQMDEESALSHVFQMIDYMVSRVCHEHAVLDVEKINSFASHQCVLFFG
jgi:hypothetical protein